MKTEAGSSERLDRRTAARGASQLDDKLPPLDVVFLDIKFDELSPTVAIQRGRLDYELDLVPDSLLWPYYDGSVELLHTTAV